MELYCNNQVVRDIVNNPVHHDRTKYVEVDRYFVKEKLVEKLIDILFVKSELQLADVLTHAIAKKKIHDSLDKLSVWDIYTLTWEGVLEWVL